MPETCTKSALWKPTLSGATLERLIIIQSFLIMKAVSLVINMSSPHFEISVQFLEPAYFETISPKDRKSLVEAWPQLLASAPCHLRSVAGSFWSYPSSGAPTSGPSCASNSVVAPLGRRNPRGYSSFLSASLCYHASLLNIFFLSIVGSSGTSPQA